MRFMNCASYGVSRWWEISATGVFKIASAVLLALGFTLLSNGCSKIQPVPPAPPPPSVTVAKPLQKKKTEWDTYNGYLEAKESANVAARVSGLIEKAPFEEGSVVKKDKVLFVLDKRPFKADRDLKSADVKK